MKMDTKRNRNWTNIQAAHQINRSYLNQYSSARLQNAKNVRQINVKQYKEDENNQQNINKKVNISDEGTEDKKKKNKDYSIFKQFCQETSFHGFNYLGEDNRSNLERAFWIIVLAFFYYESVLLLIQGYQTFNTRTVIINIDGSPPLVSDIPFPALTICSSNQITKSGLESVENDEILREYKDDIISLLCPVYRSHEEPNETARKLIESSMVTSFIQKVGALNCSRTIFEQFWLSSLQEDNCHNIQQIVTFFGICQTFNMLPLDQLYTESFYHNHYKHQINNHTTGAPELGITWTPENGYVKSANFKEMEAEIPYRTTGVSLVHSLVLFADIQDDDFSPMCNRGTKGFFVIAHNPAELPGMPHPVRFIPSDRTSILKVKTTTHKLDKRLISWKPSERKCYLERERQLTFFRYYTEQNCRLECHTNFTLLLCGCVPFYMPHLTKTPVCGPSKEHCFRTLWSKVSPLHSNKICKCLPSCTELTFNVDFTNSEKNHTGMLSTSWKMMTKGTTKFQIFYKDKVVSSYRRLLLFDWNDGVALLGGIMCLFCGGSFLSFFELINFFIFRVIKPKKVEKEKISKSPVKIERY